MNRAGNVYGMSWLPGTATTGGAEAAQERGRPLVLLAAPAVGEIAAGDDQLRPQPLDQRARARASTSGLLAGADVQVGDVENPRWPRPTQPINSIVVVDEPAEIVEDLYLGLRAGGALRKQRRGEPLTAEEQEALGRWQQMSSWRKAVAIGAFSVGTFGLGFTLGGLVFGRWRRA